MNVSFNEVWYFIKTTHVEENVVHIIHPETGEKISSDIYINITSWEKRYDINVLKNLWDKCFTFIVHGSCATPEIRKLIEEIETDHNVDAQAHIYMGKSNSRSFPIHADNPDNLIVQCIGKSKVTIYNEFGDYSGWANVNEYLSVKEQHILEPGNSIFIPSLQYHLFEPLTDRLSISIPMCKR